MPFRSAPQGAHFGLPSRRGACPRPARRPAGPATAGRLSSRSGLYEAITELPTRQFTVIVFKYLLGYETPRIARFMGLHERTVDYHGRKGTERLRVQLCLPATPRPKKGDDK
ncbi:sigma factor-like helix-turn-helix DNA-binding protein [Streptomyces goshikiensis]|uniref:sigma-70 region 4 domain-containing protein n=1 Tax=Streptomyces goshikiensis TaxID=1942 RepID=UPI00371A6AB0